MKNTSKRYSKNLTQEEFLKLFSKNLNRIHYSAADDLKGHEEHEERKFKPVIDFDKIPELNKDGFGIFFTVNKFPEGERKKNKCKRVRAIFIDDDQTLKLKTDWPLPPSIVVESSPNKFHYYWLTNSKKFKEYELVMQTMVDSHGADKKARDISRVLRVPGTYHRKGDAFKVKVISGNSKKYDWETIKIAFPPAKRKKSNYTNDSEGSFDLETAVQALTSTDDLHGSMISIAMSLVNHNVNKSMFVQFMISAYKNINFDDVEQARALEVSSRFSEIHLNECYDSGVKKIEGENKKTIIVKTKKPPKIKESLIFPDDIYGEFIKDVCLSTKQVKNSVAAMVHANSIIRFAADGYATDEEDICTGINVVVGNTFCGKSVALKAAKKYLTNESLFRITGAAGSGEGFEDDFIKNKQRPSLVMFPDEFGFMLSGIKNNKAGGGVIGRILEYVTNGLNVIVTRSLANRPPEQLHAPRLTISGNTTLESLVTGINKSDVETGLVNRMCFFYVQEYSEVVKKFKKPDKKFKDRIEEIMKFSEMDEAIRCDEYKLVKINKDVKEVIYKKRVDLNNHKNPLNTNIRGRHVEVAKSFAVSRAVFVDPENPIITMDIWQWAFGVVEFAMKSIEYLFDTCLSSSNEFAESEQKLVQRLSENKGDMKKRDALSLRPYTEWDSGTKRKFLKNLIDAEIIEEYTNKTSSSQSQKRIRLIGEL